MAGLRRLGDWKLWLPGVMAASTLATSGLAQFGTRPNGEHVARLANPGSRAVALFFVASDCPVSDRTFPEMKRVREEFGSRGVRIWFVYPNTTEQAVGVLKHQHAFDAEGDVLFDPNGDLVRLTHAQVTPEISVLVPNGADGWKPAYTGRIDDRFVHIGLERPQAREHFAEAAIEAVLDGKPVPRATGTPVGCGIVNPGAGMGISGAGAMATMGKASSHSAAGGKAQP